MRIDQLYEAPLDYLLGIKQNRNGFVDMPILSRIGGNLYVGMTPIYWPVYGLHHFRAVFNLYTFQSYQRRAGDAWPEIYQEFRIHDSQFEEANRGLLDKMAHKLVQCFSAGPTLVHCEMGVNRSNLLVAMALIRQGMTWDRAVEGLRKLRHPDVLCNEYFIEVLRTYKPGEIRPDQPSSDS